MRKNSDPDNDETPEPPHSAFSDWAPTIIEAAMSGGASFGASFIPVPGVGAILSAAAVVLAKGLRAPLEKRERAYLESIAAGVEMLRGRVADIEQRIASDVFLTAFLHAGHISMRTHQHDKLRALRNAVLNVATGSAPDEDLQIVFLSFVDLLTPWHLRLLAFLDGPVTWLESHRKNIPANPSLDGVTLVDYAFPELNLRNSHTTVYLDQLATQGLLRDDWNERTTYRVPGTRGASRTSALGKMFLAFITSPIPAQEEGNNDTKRPEDTVPS